MRIVHFAILGTLLSACTATLAGFGAGEPKTENENDAAIYSFDCSQYAMTAREAQEYFRLATPEEFITLDLGDGVWGPCSATGTVMWRGRKATYRIYTVGNVGVVFAGHDEHQWYLCAEKCCNRLRKVCSG